MELGDTLITTSANPPHGPSNAANEQAAVSKEKGFFDQRLKHNTLTDTGEAIYRWRESTGAQGYG